MHPFTEKTPCIYVYIYIYTRNQPEPKGQIFCNRGRELMAALLGETAVAQAASAVREAQIMAVFFFDATYLKWRSIPNTNAKIVFSCNLELE